MPNMVVPQNEGGSLDGYLRFVTGRLAAISGSMLILASYLTLLPIPSAAATSSFGDPHFQSTWSYNDQVVANQTVNRTWMWGPQPNGDAIVEPYWDSTAGWRLVQYFDKTRMEITHPNGDQSSIWYVTNGLLAKELITGNMQIGDDKFVQYAPAQVNVAGDANDPNGPTYATFNALMGFAALPNGLTITQTVDRSGSVSDDNSLASYGVTALDVGSPTNHSVASVFWDFMTSSGPVETDGNVVSDRLFPNAFYATGYPLTEPYWTRVLVGGIQKRVLVQVFERRVLTYTPDNSDGWKVEAGNVGQHYYTWRYTDLQQVPMLLTSLAGTDAAVRSCAPSQWSTGDQQADAFYSQHVTVHYQSTNCRVFHPESGVWWNQESGTASIYAGDNTSGIALDTQPESDFFYFHEPSDPWGGSASWNRTSIERLYDRRVIPGVLEHISNAVNGTSTWQSTAATDPPQVQSGSYPDHPPVCALDSWQASSGSLGMWFAVRMDPNSLPGAPEGKIPYVFDVTGVNLDGVDLSQAVTAPQGATVGKFQTGNCLFVYMDPNTPAGQYSVGLNVAGVGQTSVKFDFLPSIGDAPTEGGVTYQPALSDLSAYTGSLATTTLSDGVLDVKESGFTYDGGWYDTEAHQSNFGDASVSLDVRQASTTGYGYACLDVRAKFDSPPKQWVEICLLSSGETVIDNIDPNYIIIRSRESVPGTNAVSDWNTLRVVSKGNASWFYVNDTLVASAQFNAISQGTIGYAVVNSSDSPMEWQVRNLTAKSLN